MGKSKEEKDVHEKLEKHRKIYSEHVMDFLKEGKSNLLSDAANIETIIFNIKGINKDIKFNIKMYLPIKQKIELATKIYNASINSKDGILFVDRNAIEIATANYIMYYYTDLCISNDKLDDVFEIYDVMQVTGLYDEIKKYIWKEKLDIDTLVGNMIKEKNLEYQQKNSAQHILKEFLNTVIDKLPTMDEIKTVIDEAKEAVSDLDPEKLEYIDKFVQAINGDSNKNENK